MGDPGDRGVAACAVEGEVFRALAEVGDAALVARHVFSCELCVGVEFAVTFHFVVFCYCEFCAGRGVDDLVADGYAVIEEVEVGEFGVDIYSSKYRCHLHAKVKEIEKSDEC